MKIEKFWSLGGDIVVEKVGGEGQSLPASARPPAAPRSSSRIEWHWMGLR